MIKVEDIVSFLPFDYDLNDPDDLNDLKNKITGKTNELKSIGIPEVLGEADEKYFEHVSLIAKMIAPELTGAFNMPSHFITLLNNEKSQLQNYYIVNKDIVNKDIL